MGKENSSYAFLMHRSRKMLCFYCDSPPAGFTWLLIWRCYLLIASAGASLAVLDYLYQKEMLSSMSLTKKWSKVTKQITIPCTFETLFWTPGHDFPFQIICLTVAVQQLWCSYLAGQITFKTKQNPEHNTKKPN